jgi:hypothetical protein
MSSSLLWRNSSEYTSLDVQGGCLPLQSSRGVREFVIRECVLGEHVIGESVFLCFCVSVVLCYCA